ncbi:MAG: hypothetical protein V4580_17370 [Bacteroidota bacterium]
MRYNWINDSNNPDNPNKNLCALAVTKALNVDAKVRYLHTIDDVVRATKTRYKVASKTRELIGATVDTIRTKLAQMTQQNELDAIAYVIHLDEHVILLSADGDTLVDTDPRNKDNRKILDVFLVY